jgi:hypothetical protein
MAKPIMLTVDDDPDVLRAIERDLRSQYGAEYRVVSSDSPDGALDLEIHVFKFGCRWRKAPANSWCGCDGERS